MTKDFTDFENEIISNTELIFMTMYLKKSINKILNFLTQKMV